MPDPLTRSDYEYILESLIYARYAHEETHYASVELKHLQLAHLERVEKKLRALRDACDANSAPAGKFEIF